MSPRSPLASPCIGVCAMDEASGWCRGCLRTLDEIAAWGAMDEVGRRTVLRQLSSRRAVWRARRAAMPAPTPDPAR